MGLSQPAQAMIIVEAEEAGPAPRPTTQTLPLHLSYARESGGMDLKL